MIDGFRYRNGVFYWKKFGRLFIFLYIFLVMTVDRDKEVKFGVRINAIVGFSTERVGFPVQQIDMFSSVCEIERWERVYLAIRIRDLGLFGAIVSELTNLVQGIVGNWF